MRHAGTRTIEGKKFTWFQLENAPVSLKGSPWKIIANFFTHMLDWVRYKRTGMNQGPYGASAYTEKSTPLYLRKVVPFPTAAAAA